MIRSGRLSFLSVLFLSVISISFFCQAADFPGPNKGTSSSGVSSPGQKERELPTGALQGAQSAYDFSVRDIDGKLVNLADYRGKTVLFVNVASKCGYTSQYKGLQSLYEKYKGKGFVILGFPSNDFSGQEPGTNAEIKKFCQSKYQVTFPMFEKAEVKGEKKQPLYRYLTEQSASEFRGEVGWNFTKFLVDGRGQVVGRFSSKVEPDAKELVEKIEKQLVN